MRLIKLFMEKYESGDFDIKLLKRKIKIAVIILIFGIIYYFVYTLTGIGFKCPVNSITGFLCPGCGISRLIVHLSRLEINSAFQSNKYLFVTIPFLIFEFIYVNYIDCLHRKQPKWNDILLKTYFVSLIIFGIVRNII